MSLRDTLLANIRRQMARRDIANMTELSRLSGVPQSTLSKFETGVHDTIKLDHIDSIARALHLDPAQLFLAPAINETIVRGFSEAMEELTPPEQAVVRATRDALIQQRRNTS